jgi:hypothetical protein
LGNPLNRIRLNDDRRHLALGEVPPDVAVEWPHPWRIGDDA